MLDGETPKSKVQAPEKYRALKSTNSRQGAANLRQVLECGSPLPLSGQSAEPPLSLKSPLWSRLVDGRASVWTAVHPTALRLDSQPGSSSKAPALALLCWLLTFAAFAATPGTTNSLPPGNVDSWSIIPRRNIFNSRRSPAYVPTQRENRPVSRIESFALVGTMDYEKGWLAFFDGNRSDFRKVAKPSDTIAGFKIVEIEPKFVKLAGTTNTIELRLGMQLRRENEGEWSVSERPESLEPAPAPSLTAHLTYQTNAPATTNAFGAIGELLTGLANGELPNFPPQDPAAFAPGGQPPSPVNMTTNPAPVASGGGSENDVLQRLMRRRQQENQ
jgi:hypothetical protein